MIASYKILWKVKARRAFLEGWLGSACLLSILMPTIISAPSLVISAFFILVIIFGDSIAALRLYILPEKSKQNVNQEILNSLIFALGFFVVIMSVLCFFNALDLPRRGHVGVAGFILFILLISPGFIAVRLASALWLYWNQLRKSQIVWGLTHAILTVIGCLGALALLIFIIYNTGIETSYFTGLPFKEILTRIIIWSLSLFISTLLFAAAGIVVFLFPAAGFSYIVARRLTHHLDNLINAANTLESGDLSARIVVEGNDEVALLQRTFNSMAENLQSSRNELNDEKEKVKELLHTQQELTAGVSHELRTPATVISGYIESLRTHWKSAPPDIVDRDLKTVSNEISRLNKILNDLLELSQAKANRLSIHPQSISIEDVIKHTVNVFQPLAWESKRVEIDINISASLPLILADPTRIEQVLFNLIQNSLRHTSPGGLIAISASKSDRWVKIEVTDTGEGISPQDLPHIWEKFYRGNQSDKSLPGTGLGLAIVKELTEAMGGQVDVESEPGRGSTFILEFQTS